MTSQTGIVARRAISGIIYGGVEGSQVNAFSAETIGRASSAVVAVTVVYASAWSQDIGAFIVNVV